MTVGERRSRGQAGKPCTKPCLIVHIGQDQLIFTISMFDAPMLQCFSNFGATVDLACIPPLLLCTLQNGVIRGPKLQRYANMLRYPFTSTPGEHAE